MQQHYERIFCTCEYFKDFGHSEISTEIENSNRQRQPIRKGRKSLKTLTRGRF